MKVKSLVLRALPLDNPPAAVGKPEEVEGIFAVVLVGVNSTFGLGDGHDLPGLDDLGFDEFGRENRKGINFLVECQGNIEGLSGSNWK